MSNAEHTSSKAKQSFLTHATIYGIGAMAVQATSMILVPLFTHNLTKAEYGILEMVYRTGEVFNFA